jgi:hypothetical protein
MGTSCFFDVGHAAAATATADPPPSEKDELCKAKATAEKVWVERFVRWLLGGFFGVLHCVQDDGMNWQQQQQNANAGGSSPPLKMTSVWGCIGEDGFDDDFSIVRRKAVRAWRE